MRRLKAMNPGAKHVKWVGLSYSEQYDQLYADDSWSYANIPKKALPKPSPFKQKTAEGATPVPLSQEVFGTVKTFLFKARKWDLKDYSYAAVIVGMHLGCLLAPMTASWKMFGLFMASYFVTGCLGITLSYHRNLSHKSFTLPKWLEYTLAYCGAQAWQGDPMEWVSTHRYHHLHCETPLDPHTIYEGFWWSHIGWLMDWKVTERRTGDQTNAKEMQDQPFYTHMQKHYSWHVAGSLALLFALGGLPALVWGGCVRICWVWHVTWFVNSASHVWGNQDFATGDHSRNNWWVGLLAFGEGWHNNHHAFDFSARHGLRAKQFDMTWIIVRALQYLGLATKVRLPTEKAMQRLAVDPSNPVPLRTGFF